MLEKISIALKKIVVCIIIVLLCGLIGTLLLCAVYMLPTEKMREHVTQDIDMIVEEGNYPEFAGNYFVRMHPNNINVKTFLLNNRGMARDNYTDAIMLGNAITNLHEIPLLQRALLVHRGNAVEHQPIESLKVAIEAGTEMAVESYPRYWHGYLVILKPLLLVFSYTQIKYINIFLQTILVILLLNKINRKIGKNYAIAMAISILFTFPFIIPMCMQYSTMTYVMLICSNILLWKWELWRRKSYHSYYFLLVGCATCYFDFLTYPIISLGIPLLLFLLLERPGKEKCIYITCDSCFMWGVGYGGIWILKWLFSTWIGKTNVLKDAIEQALYRMSGNTATQSSSTSGIKAIFANFSCYTNILFIILILITFIMMYMQMKRNHMTVVSLLKEQWIFLTIAFLPLIWYGILKNHSYDHSSFTYRAMCVTVFGIWTAILNMCEIEEND